jgi:hypothetical protein
LPDKLGIDAIFSESKKEVQTNTSGYSGIGLSQNNSTPANPPIIQKKKKEDIGTPSISQALLGKFENEVAEKIMIPEYYARETREVDQIFTEEQLLEVWPEFSEKYSSQVHLFNTLSIKPVLLDNFKIKITVENSVQQDQVRMLKPEIIGFLSRRLKNKKIDVVIEMVKPSNEGKLFTDEQKMQAMMKKNPALQKLKIRFNLDFNG